MHVHVQGDQVGSHCNNEERNNGGSDQGASRVGRGLWICFEIGAKRTCW